MWHEFLDKKFYVKIQFIVTSILEYHFLLHGEGGEGFGMISTYVSSWENTLVDPTVLDNDGCISMSCFLFMRVLFKFQVTKKVSKLYSCLSHVGLME